MRQPQGKCTGPGAGGGGPAAKGGHLAAKTPVFRSIGTHQGRIWHPGGTPGSRKIRVLMFFYACCTPQALPALQSSTFPGSLPARSIPRHLVHPQAPVTPRPSGPSPPAPCSLLPAPCQPAASQGPWDRQFSPSACFTLPMDETNIDALGSHKANALDPGLAAVVRSQKVVIWQPKTSIEIRWHPITVVCGTQVAPPESRKFRDFDVFYACWTSHLQALPALQSSSSPSSLPARSIPRHLGLPIQPWSTFYAPNGGNESRLIRQHLREMHRAQGWRGPSGRKRMSIDIQNTKIQARWHFITVGYGTLVAPPESRRFRDPCGI
eukprot:gene9777-biopygen10767